MNEKKDAVMPHPSGTHCYVLRPTPLLFWIMVIKGSSKWGYIKAELPCNKGELMLSFRYFHIIIAWQSGGVEGT